MQSTLTILVAASVAAALNSGTSLAAETPTSASAAAKPKYVYTGQEEGRQQTIEGDLRLLVDYLSSGQKATASTSNFQSSSPANTEVAADSSAENTANASSLPSAQGASQTASRSYSTTPSATPSTTTDRKDLQDQQQGGTSDHSPQSQAYSITGKPVGPSASTAPKAGQDKAWQDHLDKAELGRQGDLNQQASANSASSTTKANRDWTSNDQAATGGAPNTTTRITVYDRGNMGVQPLVLIPSGSSQFANTSHTGEKNDKQGSDPSTGKAGDDQQSESAGEGFVLVFEPGNYGSQMALALAHGMIAGSGLNAHRSQSAGFESDRMPVRGHAEESVDSGGHATERTTREAEFDTGHNDRWLRAGRSAHVKVTGRVLDAHGIRAFEVTGIEPLSGSESGESLNGQQPNDTNLRNDATERDNQGSTPSSESPAQDKESQDQK